VFRARRGQPWWFSSVDAEAPETSGRFDLPAPDGACYLAATQIAAVLEALQDFGEGLLPDAELRSRRTAEVAVPRHAPDAASLASQRARGSGVTVALWGGADRPLSQAWAVALRRAGWQALFHGVQHDPVGRLRAVTLFDVAGAHPPYDDGDGWPYRVHTLHDSSDVVRALSRFGVTVTRGEVELPLISLDDADLG
jgi:hypothetical protein